MSYKLRLVCSSSLSLCWSQSTNAESETENRKNIQIIEPVICIIMSIITCISQDAHYELILIHKTLNSINRSNVRGQRSSTHQHTLILRNLSYSSAYSPPKQAILDYFHKRVDELISQVYILKGLFFILYLSNIYIHY